MSILTRTTRWGLALALACAMSAPAAASASELTQVTFDGPGAMTIACEGDAFDHVGAMVPGDAGTGTVLVSNGTDSPAQLWFWAEAPEGDEDLLSAVQLVIEHDGHVVYSGALHPAGWSEPIELGIFEAGEEAELAYHLSLPAEAANDLSHLAGSIQWAFAAQEADATEPPASIGPEPSEPTPGVPSQGAVGGSGSWLEKLAQTGLMPVMGFVAAFGAAIGAGAFLTWRRRRREARW